MRVFTGSSTRNWLNQVGARVIMTLRLILLNLAASFPFLSGYEGTSRAELVCFSVQFSSDRRFSCGLGVLSCVYYSTCDRVTKSRVTTARGGEEHQLLF